jgi:hypothetical protein
MPPAVPAHSATIEIAEPFPPEVQVGADITVKVRVTCSGGCDLRNVPLKVVAPDGAAIPSRFTIGDTDDCGRVHMKAPPRAGDHTWTLVLPAQESSGTDLVHHECVAPISFRTKPVDSSLAVWDIPSSVVTGRPLQIKVGAKSSADCALAGKAIEICGEDGTVEARSVLGDTPFPGTSALYWAAVDLVAPPKEGVFSLSARFEAGELDLDHNSSVTRFGFVVVRPPEHMVTVRVVEQETGLAITDVQIRLGAYRAETDQNGQAQINSAKGTFELNIWKVGYDAPPRTVAVDADTLVQVDAVVVPEDDPDAGWT